jgi:predicted TIM-barrel fold metal-dependent hydrolase
VIIDFHTHIFPSRLRESRAEYLERDPLFAHLYADPKAKMATAEELIASMDREGIDVSVALNIGWGTHKLCVETNDYIMEAAARYPRRLIGFGAIQPKAGAAAIAEIERCARGGLRGIGEMRPDIQGFDLDDGAIMEPVMEAAGRYGLLFLTHASEPVGHIYPGKGSLTPDVLCRFISRFPEAPIVCAHWGGGLPFYALMPEVASALAKVYFDTAATPFLYRPQIFKHVAEIAGIDKILFGSDNPLLSPGRIIRQLRSAGLGEKAEDLILGGNARRLLDI